MRHFGGLWDGKKPTMRVASVEGADVDGQRTGGRGESDGQLCSRGTHLESGVDSGWEWRASRCLVKRARRSPTDVLMGLKDL